MGEIPPAPCQHTSSKLRVTRCCGPQAEIQDLQNEFAREKEDILDTIRELSRQLKLRQLIMTSYIPLEQALRSFLLSYVNDVLVLRPCRAHQHQHLA